MISMMFVWFVVALVFFVAELSSPGFFYFFSLVGGAICAFVIAFADFSLAWQVSAFIGGSLSVFAVLRRLIRSSYGMHHTQRTAVNSLIGRKVVVIAALPEHGYGYVKVYGDEWMARERAGRAVAQGVVVEIVAISGSHVVVTIIA